LIYIFIYIYTGSFQRKFSLRLLLALFGLGRSTGSVRRWSG